MEETLFNPETYQHSLERLGNITAATQPHWGEMTSAQMLAHCAEVQEVCSGQPLREKTPFMIRLLKPMIRKIVIKGVYRKGEKTHPAYKQSTPKDFDAEKERLLAALDTFVSEGTEKAAVTPHAFFGTSLTAAEKGRAMYKHLEHHLVQFGV